MTLCSVIIVNWNGKRFLAECLDALAQQTVGAFDIILVDNGSEDGSSAYVKRHYPEVKVIELPENRGFCGANNIALKSMNTKYVALLNNDAIPHPKWLATLLDAIEANDDAGFAASKILFHSTPGMIDRAGDAYTVAGAGLLRGRGEPAWRYDRKEWIFGACAGAALYRSRMLRAVGAFDEDFFLLHEDVDLSFRAQLQGYRCIYVPEALVYHKASSSVVHDSPISVYYGHRNLEWVYIKNMPARLIVLTIIPHLIYDAAAFLYFLVHGRGKDYMRAKADALRGSGKALEKRRWIQKSRRVDDRYVWGLLGKELLLPRLVGRFQKS